MKRNLLLLFFLSYSLTFLAQTNYEQHFDSVQLTGWNHYALYGSDFWERGTPAKLYLNNASSAPNTIVTATLDSTPYYSYAAFETPNFDFSSSTPHVLTFDFRSEISSSNYEDAHVEYSTDNGVSWHFLKCGTTKQLGINWNIGLYNFGSDYGLTPNTYKNALITLDSLINKPNIKFRFYFASKANKRSFFAIDNFKIHPLLVNIQGLLLKQYKSVANNGKFYLYGEVYYTSNGIVSKNDSTQVFWSTDTILDASDISVFKYKSTYFKGYVNYPGNVASGTYYALLKHDYNNQINESDENDNISIQKIIIDSVFPLPIIDDFESTKYEWKTDRASNALASWLNFKKGECCEIGVQGNHSGLNSWSVQTDDSGWNEYYLTSPFINFKNSANNVLCVFQKSNQGSHQGNNPLGYRMTSKTVTYINNQVTPVFNNSAINFIRPIKKTYTWQCSCSSLADLDGDSLAAIQFLTNNYVSVNIDDVYIGQPKPDLTIETQSVILPGGTVNDTLHYWIMNSGLGATGVSKTKFYWSKDSIFNATAIFLGDKIEPTILDTSELYQFFTFHKPTSTQGNYYIFYIVDADSSINEMREYNNAGKIKVTLSNTPLSLPYTNDFETQINNWTHQTDHCYDRWKWITIQDTALINTFSQSKAWISGDTVDYSKNIGGSSHLYSPYFDLTSTPNPILEFDFKTGDYQFTTKDQSKIVFNVDYSYDGGVTWNLLDTMSSSHRLWYNPKDYEPGNGVDIYFNAPYVVIEGKPINSFVNSSGRNRMYFAGKDAKDKHKSNIDLRRIKQLKNVVFRFSFYCNDSVGIMAVLMDNFSIKEKFHELNNVEAKTLHVSRLATSIPVKGFVENDGNYECRHLKLNYYLSADSNYDGTDAFADSSFIEYITPRERGCFMHIVPTANISNYNYIIIKIDPDNQFIEQNENNNTIVWALNKGGVKDFPYKEDFDTSVINGWVGYVQNIYSKKIDEHRVYACNPNFSNIQNLQKSYRVEYFSFSNFKTYDSTRVFVQSPSFDFTNRENIRLKFYLCNEIRKNITAADSTYTRFQFSVDGGSHWKTLDISYLDGGIDSQYLYPNWQIDDMGWHFSTCNYATHSIRMNYFKNNPNVLFRFEQRYPYSCYGGTDYSGFLLDSIAITSSLIDSTEDTLINSIHAIPNDPSILIRQAGNMLIFESDSDLYAYNIAIYDLTGKRIIEQTIEQHMNTHSLDISNTNCSVYQLVFYNRNKNRTIKKRFIPRCSY